MREINLKKLLDKLAGPITADTIPDGIITKNKLASNVIDIIYPVGAVYLSTVQTSPAALFGGTWERVQDRFLLAAGDDYAAGETGGSAQTWLNPENLPSHTHEYNKASTETGQTVLSVFQMPSHSHTYKRAKDTTGSTKLTVSQIPAHTHDVIMCQGSGGTSTTVTTEKGSGRAENLTLETGGSQGHAHTVNLYDSSTEETGGGNGHSHGITTTVANTGATGGGVSFSIMPPYLAVYVWRRTA